VDWGIIPENAIGGGNNFYLKFGVMFDSRDQRANPMKGIWTEAAIRWAPSFISNRNYPNTQIGISHRQYFTIIPKDLSFAYRLGYQARMSGEVPWYLQPVMMTTYLTSFVSQGLGGGKTLRGVLRNRVVGDGFVLGNFEFRWKAIYTSLFKQNFYIAFNAFVDAGMIVHPMALDTSGVPQEEFENYFDQEKDSLHGTYGAGVRFAMNENFIVAFDYGRAMDRRDGISGFYVGLNYLY
jgi:outer membrane protein assembly factor BamA